MLVVECLYVGCCVFVCWLLCVYVGCCVFVCWLLCVCMLVVVCLYVGCCVFVCWLLCVCMLVVVCLSRSQGNQQDVLLNEKRVYELAQLYG